MLSRYKWIRLKSMYVFLFIFILTSCLFLFFFLYPNPGILLIGESTFNRNKSVGFSQNKEQFIWTRRNKAKEMSFCVIFFFTLILCSSLGLDVFFWSFLSKVVKKRKKKKLKAQKKCINLI